MLRDFLQILFRFLGSIIPVVIEVVGKEGVVLIAPVGGHLLTDPDQINEKLGHAVCAGIVVVFAGIFVFQSGSA